MLAVEAAAEALLERRELAALAVAVTALPPTTTVVRQQPTQVVVAAARARQVVRLRAALAVLDLLSCLSQLLITPGFILELC